MISLKEARALIQAGIRPLASQILPLDESYGHVLREDVSAPEDMPAFDRSAMDGYALDLDDPSPCFRITGEIQPGMVPKFKINRGECARIFTGAQIPDGASQVVMQEHVRAEGNSMTLTQRNRVTHIRRRGEDARRGDLLLKTGTRLGGGELALLAGLGAARPKVSPIVRVAHFVTGNELVDPAEKPHPGQIRDCNGTLVAAFLRQWECGLARQERVADDFELLVKKVREAEGAFDLLLVSGGASAGDYDFGGRLLTTLGFQIHFEKINLRPGKPLIFATRGNQAAFILPGNPISHWVTLHAAVRPALESFTGAAPSWPLAKVRLAENFDHRPDARETFWPARVTIEDGGLVARALRWQSSGDVTGLAGANALLHFSGGSEPPKAGDDINALLPGLP